MKNFIVNTIPSKPDQRDIPFAPKTLPPYPASVDLMPNVEEVEDQGQFGTCVANGVCSQCEWLVKSHGISTDLSRAFVYTAGREITGLPPEVEGMVARDAYKALYRYGVPLEAVWPYTQENVTKVAPESVFVEADSRKVGRYEAVYVNWLFGGMERVDKVNRIKAALAEGLPVGLAMMVTSSLYSLTGPWRSHNYQLVSQSNAIGGHYMAIIGYDDSVGMFLVQNSWGPLWGDGGFCGLPYSIVDEPFFEAWLIRDFAGYAVPESPGIKLEIKNRFVIDARVVPTPDLLGTTTNVWIAAKLPSGQIFMKQSLDSDEFKPLVWPEFPIAGQLLLEADTRLSVIKWMNLEPYVGADIYVACGQSPLNWHLVKLCTI